MKASLSMRTWFALMSAILWSGIFITGYRTANWLLYLPAIGLASASIIGWCPVERAIFTLLNRRKNKTAV